jgi:hypothetical protein
MAPGSAARSRALSPRAKARLRAARQLLEAEPARFGLSRGWRLAAPTAPYDAIQAAISTLAQPAREELRGLVDWVEDYEATEPERGG